MDTARDVPPSIVVQLTPARLGAEEWPARNTFSAKAAVEHFLRLVRQWRSEGEARSYDALVYTALALPNFGRPPKAPPGRAAEYAGMPLVSVEHVVVRWRKYREYIAAWLAGHKAADAMRDRLFEMVSPGLAQVFATDPPSGQRVRIWFSSDTPELYELPWESLADAKVDPHADTANAPEPGRRSFVRGLPPEGAEAPLAVHGRLRLALVDPSADPPTVLTDALTQVEQQVEITHLRGDARVALHHVVRGEFELAHIVADGDVSLAGEGILTFGAPAGEPGSSAPLGPGELASLLRGSRVRVVSLTASQRTRSLLFERGAQLNDGTEAIPSAYRAFALLGSSRHPLPTVVAPIGPGNDAVAQEFWSTFYATLADGLAVEPAVARARAVGAARIGARTLPIALCLRQRGHQTFQRVRAERATADHLEGPPDAVSLSTQIEHSDSLTAILGRLGERFGGLPDVVGEFLSHETKAQDARRDALDRLRSEEAP